MEQGGKIPPNYIHFSQFSDSQAGTSSTTHRSEDHVSLHKQHENANTCSGGHVGSPGQLHHEAARVTAERLSGILRDSCFQQEASSSITRAYIWGGGKSYFLLTPGAPSACEFLWFGEQEGGNNTTSKEFPPLHNWTCVVFMTFIQERWILQNFTYTRRKLQQNNAAPSKSFLFPTHHLKYSFLLMCTFASSHQSDISAFTLQRNKDIQKLQHKAKALQDVYSSKQTSSEKLYL